MSLDEFCSSNGSERDSTESVDSEFENCRTDILSDAESLDLPEYVSVWASDDGLIAMMEVAPSDFRERVSIEVKDRAKEKGLVYLEMRGPEPVIVLTDDPEEYSTLLETFGLEDYLLKRCKGAI